MPSWGSTATRAAGALTAAPPLSQVVGVLHRTRPSAARRSQPPLACLSTIRGPLRPSRKGRQIMPPTGVATAAIAADDAYFAEVMKLSQPKVKGVEE